VTPAHAPRVRLDEVLGDDWALITTASHAVPADSDVPAFVVGVDITDDEGVLSDWLTAFDAESVLVRPDRYVFGVADDAGGVRTLLDAVPTGTASKHAVLAD
jgi:3-(3-hydroxy-phenyl)propionate hydroxylase